MFKCLLLLPITPPHWGAQESHHQVTPISVVISSHLCCVHEHVLWQLNI